MPLNCTLKMAKVLNFMYFTTAFLKLANFLLISSLARFVPPLKSHSSLTSWNRYLLLRILEFRRKLYQQDTDEKTREEEIRCLEISSIYPGLRIPCRSTCAFPSPSSKGPVIILCSALDRLCKPSRNKTQESVKLISTGTRELLGQWKLRLTGHTPSPQLEQPSLPKKQPGCRALNSPSGK